MWCILSYQPFCFTASGNFTPPKFSIASEKEPFQEERIIFQSSFFIGNFSWCQVAKLWLGESNKSYPKIFQRIMGPLLNFGEFSLNPTLGVTFLPHVLCVERFEARTFRTTFASRCQTSNIPTRTQKKTPGLSGWWFQIFLYFHPYLGKIPNLTNIFQMGWNHQLVMVWESFPTICILNLDTSLVEKLIQDQPIHHNVVSSTSDWTLGCFSTCQSWKWFQPLEDGISLPALPGERFHFTKTGKRPEKQSHGDILKNFPLEQLTRFFGFPFLSHQLVLSVNLLPCF